jgi:hypothetical protein
VRLYPAYEKSVIGRRRRIRYNNGMVKKERESRDTAASIANKKKKPLNYGFICKTDVSFE